MDLACDMPQTTVLEGICSSSGKFAGLIKRLLMQDMQRPLYMQPKDAIEYGIIDGIVKPQTDIIDEVMNAEQWDKQAGLVAR